MEIALALGVLALLILVMLGINHAAYRSQVQMFDRLYEVDREYYRAVARVMARQQQTK